MFQLLYLHTVYVVRGAAGEPVVFLQLKISFQS